MVILIDERPDAFLSKGEYDGMMWIQNNLPLEAIIATDRTEKPGWSGNYVASVWYAYSAFSGRQFFNEGSDYTSSVNKLITTDRIKKVRAITKART